jgi:hypothetical protein
MPYVELTKNIFDCSVCETRCDGKSKLNYQFLKDVEFAEQQEKIIIDNSKKFFGHNAVKTSTDGYPDLELLDTTGEIIKYIEVKAQRRTFMSVEKLLPSGNLKPSETVALNLSDLKRYFKIRMDTKLPIDILWVVSQRPCIANNQDYLIYYQDIDVLKKSYENYQNLRTFRRKSGSGDIVNGVHKGVVVNYHFSLNELTKLNFDL